MNLLTLTYEQNKMPTDEEFLGAIKMVSGEEVLSKVTSVNDENGNYVILDNPIIVEEVTVHHKIGAKVSPWMKFSKEEQFIVPMDRIITIVECDPEVVMFYELSLKRIDPTNHPRPPRAMGRVGTVDEARDKLESLFNKKNQ
jgi:hypothetical protein